MAISFVLLLVYIIVGSFLVSDSEEMAKRIKVKIAGENMSYLRMFLIVNYEQLKIILLWPLEVYRERK